MLFFKKSSSNLVLFHERENACRRKFCNAAEGNEMQKIGTDVTPHPA